jgi:hypothetical protein
MPTHADAHREQPQHHVAGCVPAEQQRAADEQGWVIAHVSGFWQTTQKGEVARLLMLPERHTSLQTADSGQHDA